ncbi:hypothetical protein J6590_061249 [Homalodisca vitripennis]|nr:hypothetical protein J6590_061249 [Homalodisca vitripennis]
MKDPAIPQNEFKECFRKWEERWNKVVACGGEYFEGDQIAVAAEYPQFMPDVKNDSVNSSSMERPIATHLSLKDLLHTMRLTSLQFQQFKKPPKTTDQVLLRKFATLSKLPKMAYRSLAILQEHQ